MSGVENGNGNGKLVHGNDEKREWNTHCHRPLVITHVIRRFSTNVDVCYYKHVCTVIWNSKTREAGVDGDGHHQTEKAPAVRPSLQNVGRPTAEVIGV